MRLRAQSRDYVRSSVCAHNNRTSIEVKKDTKWRAGPTGSVENDPTKTLKESVLCIGSVRGL